MQLVYFVVDREQQLRPVPRAIMEGLWKGRRTATDLGCDIGEELRLISVVRDETFEPKMCFFVRLELENGLVRRESRLEAYEAMSKPSRRRYDSPAARRQFRGWPDDWQTQLAVALDVPARELRRVGLGGPLLMADLWGIPIEKVLEYFELADEEDESV